MDEKGKKYLKWGLVGVLGVVAGIFVVPFIIAAMANIAVAAAYGLGLFAFWMFLPAISEAIAAGAWATKNAVLKADPVGKLWRDFHEFLKEIDAVQENINLVATEEESARAELRKNKVNFDQLEVMEYEEQISQITDAKVFLMEERDRLRDDAKQMEKDIKKNESHWKMGNALVRAGKAVDKASGISSGTQGGRIAMDTIQNRLAEGRARMNVLRSQRSADGLRELMKQRKAAMTIDATATEVKPAPALSNNPSPVIAAPVASKTETLLSKL